MPTRLIVAALLLSAASSFADPVLLPVDRPALHADDSWRYRNTTELQGRFSKTSDEVTIIRTEGDAILVRGHQIDSPLQPSEVLIGADWSRFRSIDGHEQVTVRPFDFPLVAGKTWSIDYSETRPNRQFSSEHWTTAYRVIGSERVTVPAGTFDAIKVEATGRWTATLAPVSSASVTTRRDEHGITMAGGTDQQFSGDATGRIYKAFWYVPSVKRAVKVIEEYYNSGGGRTESRTAELESYKLAG